MTEFIKRDHTISEETVREINDILKTAGSKWTVGQLMYEIYLLESDIRRAGHDAYLTVDLEESKKKYEFKHELEKKHDLFYKDLEEG